MQSYKDNVLKNTDTGTIDELTKRIKEISDLIDSRGTYHVLGEIPKKGDEITINGLAWTVNQVNKRSGRMVLFIKQPLENGD